LIPTTRSRKIPFYRDLLLCKKEFFIDIDDKQMLLKSHYSTLSMY